MRSLTAVSSNGDGQADNSFDAQRQSRRRRDVRHARPSRLTAATPTRFIQDAPGGSVDVFTYTLTDGDGDTSQATLTITNPDHMPTVGANAVVQLDDDALAGRQSRRSRR